MHDPASRPWGTAKGARIISLSAWAVVAVSAMLAAAWWVRMILGDETALTPSIVAFNVSIFAALGALFIDLGTAQRRGMEENLRAPPPSGSMAHRRRGWNDRSCHDGARWRPHSVAVGASDVRQRRSGFHLTEPPRAVSRPKSAPPLADACQWHPYSGDGDGEQRVSWSSPACARRRRWRSAAQDQQGNRRCLTQTAPVPPGCSEPARDPAAAAPGTAHRAHLVVDLANLLGRTCALASTP